MNKAKKGGGITVNALHSSNYCSAIGNKLLINNCAFDNNTALDGSSAFISQSGKECRTLLRTLVCDSNFTNAQCGISSQSEIYYCSGNILIELFSLTFRGVLLFSGNNLSALYLRSSLLKLLPSTQLQFINNSAINGAALHIVDCSSVFVNNDTSLLFKKNTASNNGGAIYVETLTCAFDKAWNCFIRHSNPTLHPDDWNTRFFFLENQDQTKYYSLENSIYIDSIKSCIWPDYSKQQTTFCWNGWFFRNTRVEDYCLNQLRSGADYIKNSGLTKYTVYPGECINLLQAITVYDVWGHDITNITYLQTDVLSGATDIVNGFYSQQCQCNFPLPYCLPYLSYFPYQLTYPNTRPCETHDVLLLADCNKKTLQSLFTNIREAR